MKNIILSSLLVLGFNAIGQNTVGLLHYDSLSYNGLSLFSPAFYNTTYLIDNCGNQVNSWQNSEGPGMSCYLIENGVLLRSGRKLSPDFPAPGIGGIVEKKDWNDNLLWRYELANDSLHAHHDIHPLPNGNVLVLAWEKHTRAEAIAAGRDSNLLGSELWMEALVELKPISTDSAEIVWYWSAWDHLIQDLDSSKNNFGQVSNHPERIDINYLFQGQSVNDPDWLHANGIDYNEHWKQIAISIRSFSEIWIIDHSTSIAEAASNSGGLYGKGGDLLYRYGNPAAYKKGGLADQTLVYQHSVQWIPQGYPYEGKLQIYNNRPGLDSSELVVLSPPQNLLGQYELDPSGIYGPDSFDLAVRDSSFYSTITSNFQVLPNGNYLVCEGSAGKVYEFSPFGDKVWEYQNPVNVNGPINQGDSPFQTMTFRFTKYRYDEEVFNQVNFQNLGPIEQNPTPNNCIVAYHNLEDGAISQKELLIEQLGYRLVSNSNYPLELALYDVNGKLVRQVDICQHCSLDLSKLTRGVYFYQAVYGSNVLSGKFLR